MKQVHCDVLGMQPQTATWSFSDLFSKQPLVQVFIWFQGRAIKNKLEMEKAVKLKRIWTANILAGMKGTEKF